MIQNALIYCRVSTEEQAREGFSLDAQEKFCRTFAKQNNFRVVEVYRDEGKSGTKLNRPALQDALDFCKRNKNINILLVQETDRLARNTKDHLTIKAILQKSDVKLISVAQPMLDDSPEGNMIDTILASVNQFQSDINSRKIKKALQEKFEEGWFPGTAPIGYQNITLEEENSGRKAKRIIQPDPDRWPLLQIGFKMYLTGNYSADEVNDILYEKGLRSLSGKKVAHSVITDALRNPFYCGIMRWKQQERTGKHKPMISVQDHKHILSIMSSHNLQACRRRKHLFILRGFTFCNICGQRYTAEHHKKKKKSYYHCSTMQGHSNRGQNILVQELEREVEKEFKNIQFNQDFINRLTAKVRKIYKEQTDTIAAEKRALNNQKVAIEKKRGVVEIKLLDNVISDQVFKRMHSKLNAELEQIQNKLFDLDAQRQIDIDVIEGVLKLTRNIYKAYKDAPYDLKRQYLGLFWEKFLIQDKEIVEAIPTKYVAALLEKKQVIIRGVKSTLPLDNITLENLLEDWEYFAELREKFNALMACKKKLQRA
ncbi:MAG: recombinase family protein [Deferribacteres bacterium]|nr:recombinase family protein [candidate division KSB1 bacterium]MCB9503088.1 recombinase family protein [Deferribacteres bacterium]